MTSGQVISENDHYKAMGKCLSAVFVPKVRERTCYLSISQDIDLNLSSNLLVAMHLQVFYPAAGKFEHKCLFCDFEIAIVSSMNPK